MEKVCFESGVKEGVIDGDSGDADENGDLA